MQFQSLKQIIAKIEQQPEWEEFRQYRQLLEYWQQTVSKDTAKYTRPLYIRREVLWVATSSAARAQDLSLQRYSLLKKLNTRLSIPLKDIRFSDSQWHQTVNTGQNAENASSQKITRAQEPIFEASKSSKRSPEDKTEPQAALTSWLEYIKQKAKSLPSCPQCSSPTPTRELELWGSCYHCIARKRSAEYRPPQVFSNH